MTTPRARREAAQLLSYLSAAGGIYEQMGRALVARDVALAAKLFAAGAALVSPITAPSVVTDPPGDAATQPTPKPSKASKPAKEAE